MHKRFPRPPKTKDPEAGPTEGTEPSITVDIEMAVVDGSHVPSPASSPPVAEKQAARRRTGKERERSDASGVRDPRKTTQRRAGVSSSTSLMEASAADASPY